MSRSEAGATMGERRKPLPREHEDTEDTIAAFDRERDEAHALNRRHEEIIRNSQRNDQLVKQDHDHADR